MKAVYRYSSDPVFLGAMALFALNELVVKRFDPPALLRHHFNDLLLIPCALPLVLRLQNGLGLRATGAFPSAAEIAGHLLVWSVLFEVAGPVMTTHATGDWRDVVCYCFGGALAGIAWRAAAIPNRRSTAAK